MTSTNAAAWAVNPSLKRRHVVRKARHSEPGHCCECSENYDSRSDGERCRVCGTVWTRRPDTTFTELAQADRKQPLDHPWYRRCPNNGALRALAPDRCGKKERAPAVKKL